MISTRLSTPEVKRISISIKREVGIRTGLRERSVTRNQGSTREKKNKKGAREPQRKRRSEMNFGSDYPSDFGFLISDF